MYLLLRTCRFGHSVLQIVVAIVATSWGPRPYAMPALISVHCIHPLLCVTRLCLPTRRLLPSHRSRTYSADSTDVASPMDKPDLVRECRELRFRYDQACSSHLWVKLYMMARWYLPSSLRPRTPSTECGYYVRSQPLRDRTVCCSELDY